MNYELVNYKNMVKKFALDYLGEDVPIRVLEIASNLCIFDPSTCRYYDASVEGICQIKEDRDALYNRCFGWPKDDRIFYCAPRNSGRYPWDKVKRPALPDIKKVIFNDPATIIFWADGTKTVVQAHDEKFDKEKGLAMAIAKKAHCNKGNYFEIFKKYCGEE